MLPRMEVLRVATWNLDGYGRRAAARLPRQTEILQSLEADVAVLTEVREGVHSPWGHQWWSAEGKLPYQPRDRAACISSRWPGVPLPARDERLSVCVALALPEPWRQVIVYGTVIPYGLDGVRRRVATAWEWHRKAVRDVVADFQDLRRDAALRDARLILAGDFNTCLDGSGWYGDVQACQELLEGLESAGMSCHTLEDIRATRDSWRANVDHVWSSSDLRPASPLKIWCDRKEPEMLSDLNGIAVDLILADAFSA